MTTTTAPVEALTVDNIEQIILNTEPAELSDRGDKIWTRRMAVALHAALLYQQSEINRLTRQLIVAQEDDKISRDFLRVSDDRCAKAEEALEPFAVAADEIPDDVPNATHIEKALPGGVPATVGDFRRARAALPKAST